MPANQINLIIDADSGQLYSDTTCRKKISLSKVGPWRTGWVSQVSILLMELDPAGSPKSVPISTDSICRLGRPHHPELGVGSVLFTYGADSATIPSDEITPQRVQQELNGLDSVKAAGGLLVSGTPTSLNVVFSTVGSKSAIEVAASTVPTASARVDVIEAGTATVFEKQGIRIIEDSAASVESFSPIAAAAATVTVQQDGAAARHIEILDVSGWPSGGSFTYSATTETGAPVPLDATAAELEALMSGVSVEKISQHRWRIVWDSVGSVTTSTTDSTGLESFSGITGSMSFTNSQLYSILQGKPQDLTLEVGEEDGEAYLTGEVKFKPSVGDVGPGTPSTPPTSTGDGIPRYDAYAEMRAATDDADLVGILGSGGGEFYYDSTDASSVDNGGSIIVRADGRRYKRQLEIFGVNVLWWGADPTGTSDSWAAIQAALDTGHCVWIPNGTYLCSDELTKNTSGQQVNGESMNSTLIHFTTDSRGFVLLETANTFWPVSPGTSDGSQQTGQLRNLRLRNVSGSSTKAGFDIEPNTQNSNYTVEGYLLENVQADFWDVGFEIRYSSKFQARNTNAKGCLTRGYHIYGSTNNCPRFEHLSVNDCPIGVTVDSMNGGIITLGDFALTETAGVEINNGQCVVMGGELESYDGVAQAPGVASPFFTVTNAYATIIGCKFLTDNGTPVVVNASGYVNVMGCVWQATKKVPGDGYDPAFIRLTSSNCMAFGYNGGLFGTGDLGNSDFNIFNTQKNSDGSYSQMSWAVAKTAGRDTHSTYTIDNDWWGLLIQQHPIDGSLGGHGGNLVTYGINGAGVSYRNDLSSPMLKGVKYDSSTKLTEGWENLIIKDGGTLTLRDPVNAYNEAKIESPKVMFVYNEGAGTMTVARHLANTAGTTINGVAANETLAPGQGAWLITDGVLDWMMVKSSAGEVTLTGAETLTNKTLATGENEISVFNETHAASHTLSAAECWGAFYTITAAATLTLPPGEEGMSLCVTTRGAVAASVKAGGSDLIYLDGTALDDGDKITNQSTSGDTATLFCDSSGNWTAITDGWTDGGA